MENILAFHTEDAFRLMIYKLDVSRNVCNEDSVTDRLDYLFECEFVIHNSETSRASSVVKRDYPVMMKVQACQALPLSSVSSISVFRNGSIEKNDGMPI